MYFVVFLPPLKKRVIIPAKWIFDVGEQLEKFINNGLNSNQWFLCYYSSKPEVFYDNHEPNENYIPDFTIDSIMDVNAGEDFDGVFFGLLVFFTREYYFKKKQNIYSFQHIYGFLQFELIYFVEIT